MAGRVYDKDATGRTVILTGARLSFAETLQEAKPPKKEPTGRKTHGTNLILERTHKDFESNKNAIISALVATCREAKKPEGWWKQLFDDDPKQLSFRKGERFKTDKGEVYKGYENNLIVVAKGPGGGARRPKIKDRHKLEVTDVSKINEVAYNGSYCDAVVSFYWTDNGGTQRITCSVEYIRSYQEGERLGGGGVYVDDDEFDDFEDDGDGFVPSNQSSSTTLDI